MRRREFLVAATAAATALATARAARAAAGRPRLVGVIDAKESLEDGSEHIVVFRDTLVAAGWTPDRLAFEFRFFAGSISHESNSL